MPIDPIDVKKSPTEAHGFLRRIRPFEGLWRALDRRTWNRVCNILEGIKVDGGWIERELTNEGKGWIIHVNPLVSEVGGSTATGSIYPRPQTPEETQGGGGGGGGGMTTTATIVRSVKFTSTAITFTRETLKFEGGLLKEIVAAENQSLPVVGEPTW